MSQESTPNTLFLGNGFSRSVFQDMPAWGNLFTKGSSPITNYTILYETYMISAGEKGKKEDTVKEELIQRIKTKFSDKSVKTTIKDLEKFGEYLDRHRVNNIITTNYDNGIEFILCDKCDYTEQTPKGMVAERIYSIRTYKQFINYNTGHKIKLWKIHGDVNRIKSVTLGFDQYCGSLSKLTEYVKGTYKSSQSTKGTECRTAMETKCKTQNFDDLSWAELFFNTNVYIVGFGMSFSEIDIWWLLNKRARFMLEIPEIINTITYLRDINYDRENEKAELFSALNAFRVTCKPIKSDCEYISNIFESIV